ncbi:hypothetical protein [Brevibacterium atlanticum]|uniref:hypothetical protein n=1 Tax=Brevibacterium atlanticum TaxID=2697563 RepID=UPI001422E6E9|nr:hypothetical protein [Brevibacterium atlanticum]
MTDPDRNLNSAPDNSKLKKEVSAWLSFSAVLTAVWVVISILSGELVTFWPAIPIGIWGLIIVVSRIVAKPGNDS